MDPQLGTTNLFLGIMALASVLEDLVVVGLGIFAYLVLRQARRAVERLEADQVGPALGKVNAILDDVKGVSGKVKDGAGRFDTLVRAAALVFQTLVNRRPESPTRHDRVM